jgi:hypothetical protein
VHVEWEVSTRCERRRESSQSSKNVSFGVSDGSDIIL